MCRSGSRPNGPGPVDSDSVASGAVDSDVPGAVGLMLEGILRGRVEAATSIDPTFARDIAERVACFTLGGGKRMRSQFLWWGLRACGGGSDPEEAEAALRLASGLELIQTCALVHDDVMDGSARRRGRAAVHTDLDAQYGTSGSGRPGGSFGVAAAILVGDLALAWADDIVADTDLRPDVRRAVRTVWQAMRTEMVAGQYLDLHGQATASRSATGAIRTAALKSALYSVDRPLALGAALAGADARTAAALCSAGRCAGLAFQLRDDLLGVFGDPEVTGKPSGGDIREGKITYLVAVARSRAEASGDRGALALLDAAVGDPELPEEALDRVRKALVSTGARSVVEARIERLAARSTRHLADAAAAPRAGRRLRELLHAAAGVPPSTPRGPSAGAPVPSRYEELCDEGMR